MMKILVMGGTRFFGRHLVQMLIEAQHEVHIFSRGLTSDAFGGSVIRHIGDRKNKSDLQKVADQIQFDVVFDQICMTAEEAQTALDVFSNKIQHYIFTSTLSVYYWGANLKEIDFNALNYKPIQREKNPSEIYAEGKRAAEKVFLSQSKIPVSIMRIPVVVAKDDYTLRLKTLVDKVSKSLPIYYPNWEAKNCFVRSTDAAKGLYWMMQEKKYGVYNVNSPEPISLKELIRVIESVVKKKAVIADSASGQAFASFGIPEDWYMNMEKTMNAGFKIDSLMNWLPQLIEEMK